MANQRIVVDIVGNDTSFQAALARSNAAAAKFGSSVGRSLGSGSGVSVAAQFDPLLDRVRRSQAQAEQLSQRLKDMDTGFQTAAGGARVLSGGLLPLIGRASAVGFAVNAAYSASRHLQDALETTGREATTTSGKFRNMGAALLSGDIVGAFEAWRRAPQTLDELGISVTEASNRMDALAVVARTSGDKVNELFKQQAKGSEDASARLTEYQNAAKEAGTGSQKLAQQLIDLVASQQAAENAQNSLADATARLGTVFRTSTGQAVAFKGAVDDLGGPRGPGAVDQINAALELERAGRQGAPPQRPLGPASRRANALIVAQAGGDLDEVLRLQTEQRDKLAKAIENSHGNVKQRQELARNYAQAVAAVITTQRQIKDQNEATAKAAAEAAAQDRRDMWSKIISGLQLGVQRAELDQRLGNDIAALEALKAGLQRQVKAGVDVASAQSQLVAVTGQIADKQDQIRQQLEAAFQAKQFRALGLSATGEEIVPGVDNLRKRLNTALQQIDTGGVNVSSKLAAHLREAANLIKKQGGDLTKSTRDAINGFLQAFEQGSKKMDDVLTPRREVQLSDRILKALGFGKDIDVTQLSKLRTFSQSTPAPQALTFTAPRGGAAASGVNINGPITVVADNPDAFLRELQKKAGRTTATARGRFPGRSLGLG